MDRHEMAGVILERLQKNRENLKQQFWAGDERFTQYAYIDDLLPNEICLEINNYFPKLDTMNFASNFREQKHVTRSSQQIVGILREVTFAFQDQRILDFFSGLTRFDNLIPDENLYGSGLSSMAKDDYLNPHLDNSHDQHKKNKRALNLLYYVTPNWKREYGGNLELWDKSVRERTEILSKFNRLAIMATNKTSFHSVSKVTQDYRRNCVSNYFFTKCNGKDFHISTFKARPGHTADAVKMSIDTAMRKGLRLLFHKGAFSPDTFLPDKHESSQQGLASRLGSVVRDSFLYKNNKS